MPPITLSELPSGPGTLVLCATPRLAAALRQRFGRLQAQQGRRRWDALDCRTLEQWLADLREAWLLRGSPQAWQRRELTPLQERTAWEMRIRQRLGEAETPLFDLGTLAQTAQEAHALQTVWQVRAPASWLTEEHRQFQQWRTDFQAWCQTHGWATAHELDTATLRTLAADPAATPLPERLVLAGFHRLPPAALQWLEALRDRGQPVYTLADEPAASEQEVRSYPDAAAECLAAAQWVQAQWARHPEAELAIIVPDLAEQRLRLQDTLENELAPWLLRNAHAEAPRPFNISLGQPLSETPLVGAALRLLEVFIHPHDLDLQALGSLLRHPHWSDPAEAVARAQVDALMRTALPAHTTLQGFIGWLDRAPEALRRATPMLRQHLATALRLNAEGAGRRLPSEWSNWLPNGLQQAGWLHRHALGSHAFQARQTFEETVQALALLDGILGPITLAETVRRLRQMCRERVFQPETEGLPRLQVLGLLEASGLRFDAAWIMGLRASVWPPAPRPNPLLPSAAQREAGSPHASAGIQQAFARQVHQRLLCAAPALVLSWPRSEGTAECQPSPLLPGPEAQQRLPSPTSGHWGVRALHEPSRLAPPMEDAHAPALGPDERVRGGTSLLKAQAICPAWAYYRHRLGAGTLEDPTEGLDPRQRGTLVHAALEHFWNTVGSSARLRALGEAGCLDKLEACVKQALDARDATAGMAPLSPRTRRLEHTRLMRLLQTWLEQERQRAVPFTVVATERELPLDLDGLPLKVQVDRIDALEDGGWLMIDYKTGTRTDTRNWASERLTEPQLPLYAAIAAPSDPTHGRVAAVAFAQVHLKEPGWAGLAAHDLQLPSVHALDSRHARRHFDAARFPDWDAVLQHWAQALRAVAAEIRQGEAAVRCADERLLEHCDVRPLLRLSERRSQWLALRRQPSAAATERLAP